MAELAWKLFALTGNVDIYLLFKEIERNVNAAINCHCYDCGSLQLYNDKHFYKSNLNQVDKNPF